MHLLRRLIDWGRTRGLMEVVGQTLTDNQPMLTFIRHLGFAVHRMKDDPEVVEAKLSLLGVKAYWLQMLRLG